MTPKKEGIAIERMYGTNQKYLYLFAIGFSVKFRNSKVKAIPAQHEAKAKNQPIQLGTSL